MIIDSNNQQPAVNVYPNGGYYGGNGGFGDGTTGGWFWIIILFFFAIFGGWGGNGNGNVAGNGFGGFVPYYGGVQQGFDQAAIMGGLNGIQTSLANAEVSRYNQQANILATLNANQNANNAAMNTLAMGLQNCCCQQAANTADLKYTVATEACADRAAVGDALQAVTAQNNANTQRILDKLCDQELYAERRENENLRNQLNMMNLAASQNAQTAAILANNEAQTQALEQYLNPAPIPAYVVQNPNCCAQNFGCRQCG